MSNKKASSEEKSGTHRKDNTQDEQKTGKKRRPRKPRPGKNAKTTHRTARKSKTSQKSGTKSKKDTAESGKKRIEGRLSVTARGFGFVTVPDGADIFIPLDNMGTGMDGDKVLSEVLREVPGKNPVGRILKVTEPSVRDIVGIFHEEKGKSFVVPDDERFKRTIDIPADNIRPKDSRKPPKVGQFVLVRRERWDDPRQNPSGKIVETLGDPKDPGIDTLVVAKSKGLRTEFPKPVLEETKKLRPPRMSAERKRREDLRDTLCFTIDPETAEDFDDAVSLVQLENGRFELGVHIADVSHYVREGSALDEEAQERGTSVYFVDKVIPMLPEKLSNDLCSLREKTDRLAFSVIMEIDSRGTVKDYRITESIIRSDRRFTYREVEDIIQGKNHPFSETVHLMMMMSLVLRKAREEKGSIDFDVPVPVISLDKNGIPHEVSPSERLDANRLVEEFMLAANLTVARHMVELNEKAKKKEPYPFVYRVHEKPDENEVEAFLDLLQRLGIQYRIPGDLEPDDYRKILDIIENLEFKDFAEKVALRSMTKAVYSTDNIGHFGLAFDAYTHFTSPIRRYPDLLVHRLLKKYARTDAAAPPSGYKKELQQICEKCSQSEIQAVDAEREHIKIKSMEFLADKVGGSYDGVIAGITSFGFFVELNHYLIEGLVHISELRDDHYEYDQDNYTLSGQRHGRVFRLGDPVRVTIKQVSVEERRADFILADG
jgi:ribonuclease R